MFRAFAAAAALFLATQVQAAAVHSGGTPASPPTSGVWLLVQLEPISAPTTFKGTVGVETVGIVNSTLWMSDDYTNLGLEYNTYLTDHDFSAMISDGATEIVVGLSTPANGEQVFRYEWLGQQAFVTKAVSASGVPEPATALLGLMGAGVLWLVRRQ